MGKQLTDPSVKSAKAKKDRYELSDGGNGLYLVVQPSGAKSWALRYRMGERPRKHTIGGYPAFGLSEARKLATAARVSAQEGKDPGEQKKAARQPSLQPQTFDELAEAYVLRHVQVKLKPTTVKLYMGILGLEADPDKPGGLRRTKNGGNVKEWHGRRLDAIDRRAMKAFLDRLAAKHVVHANRVLAILRAMWNWALDKELVETSPCARIKAPSGKEASRERVLTDDELRLVLRAAERLEWPFRGYVQMLALTLQRRNEVAGMRWSEVNLKERAWVLPQKRTKNKKAHGVPLSDTAIALLEEQKRTKREGWQFCFTTTGHSGVSGFSKVKKQLDRFIAEENGGEPILPWTLHDLRRTGASIMPKLWIELPADDGKTKEMKKVRIDVPTIEKILNHIGGTFGGIVGTYQRYDYADERCLALESYARFLDRLTHSDGANVSSLDERRAAKMK